MKQKKQLKQLSTEYITLKEQDKVYILGVVKALAFAANNGWNPAGNKKPAETCIKPLQVKNCS